MNTKSTNRWRWWGQRNVIIFKKYNLRKLQNSKGRIFIWVKIAMNKPIKLNTSINGYYKNITEHFGEMKQT